MTYNVFVQMTFEADTADEAEEKAYNALSLIPKGEAPEIYDLYHVETPEGQL
ncbi:MAG: hypothetical protein AB7D36_11155 [Oscillospiraceae bacterium]